MRIYPDFAVGDARLTERITMRDLVCNCTGITRRDIELFFPSRPRTAAEMIRALRTYPSAGTFRRTYQYNNQMVAAGGYIAARAAGGGTGDLAADYVAQMRRLVFDPIGMTSTTFSLEAVLADPDHATPHGRTADLRLTPIPLELERLLQPLIPSGGSWSNARDLARYLITQLNRGVAPDGRRVVSAANLEETWRPQVPVSPQASYALGWAAGAYKGARLLNHSGETNGFTADLTMLPDAGLGVAVLSNAQRDRHFVSAVRTRVLELAFGQPMEADALYARRAEQERQAAEQQLGRVQPRLDPEVATVYPGVYTNPALGEVSLAVEVGGLLANVVQAGVPDRLIVMYKWYVDIRWQEVTIRWKTAFRPSCLFILGQLLLTVITVGIYGPAAFLRLYRYFAGRTVLSDPSGEIGRLGFDGPIGRGFGLLWGQALLSLITAG